MHVCMCECLLMRLHENVFCLGTWGEEPAKNSSYAHRHNRNWIIMDGCESNSAITKRWKGKIKIKTRRKCTPLGNKERQLAQESKWRGLNYISLLDTIVRISKKRKDYGSKTRRRINLINQKTNKMKSVRAGFFSPTNSPTVEKSAPSRPFLPSPQVAALSRKPWEPWPQTDEKFALRSAVAFSSQPMTPMTSINESINHY